MHVRATAWMCWTCLDLMGRGVASLRRSLRRVPSTARGIHCSFCRLYLRVVVSALRLPLYLEPDVAGPGPLILLLQPSQA